MKQIPLVAESEWEGPDDIDDDFQKLLLARADLRVMVFDGGYFPNEDKFETFKLQIGKFGEIGITNADRYLLAAWSQSKDAFEPSDRCDPKNRDETLPQHSVVFQPVRRPPLCFQRARRSWLFRPVGLSGLTHCTISD